LVRIFHWIRQQENQLLYLINGKSHHDALIGFMRTITHIGGASATILFAIIAALYAPDPWNKAGTACLTALVASHIPVALIKKYFRRPRPYAVLSDTKLHSRPLKDYSFPSGHSTAIFAITVPFFLLSPSLILVLLPIAMIVSISRIYLGLHYPSDCLAGSLIGLITAVICFTVLG
jgi:undecaprenyl-diphosphatase